MSSNDYIYGIEYETMIVSIGRICTVPK